MAASAPFSAKSRASKAEVSRTMLRIARRFGRLAFFLCFGAPLANQLVNDAYAGDPIRRQCFLGGTKGLSKGMQVKPLRVCRNIEVAARLNAELLTQPRWNDDAACRIDADTGRFWRMVFWHKDGARLKSGL